MKIIYCSPIDELKNQGKADFIQATVLLPADHVYTCEHETDDEAINLIKNFKN